MTKPFRFVRQQAKFCPFSQVVHELALGLVLFVPIALLEPGYVIYRLVEVRPISLGDRAKVTSPEQSPSQTIDVPCRYILMSRMTRFQAGTPTSCCTLKSGRVSMSLCSCGPSD